MSVYFEETSQIQQPSSPSRLQITERTTTRVVTKNKNLRLDSPTTIQACNELGLLLEDLKQKNIEEFKEAHVEEAILNLRYNHYLKRYNQTIKDVMAARKRILKKLKNQQLEQEQQQQQFSMPSEVRSQTAIPSYHILPGAGINAHNSNLTKKNITIVTPLSPLSSLNRSNRSPLMVNFNKTVSYFRTSHRSADLKDIGDIVGTDENTIQTLNSPVGNFYKTFSDEIGKFNKSKKQQQREAKGVYEEEIRRIKMVEALQEREKKREERDKKIRLEKKKKEEERKRIEEDKIERIREIEKNFRIKKQQEKESIKQKLDGARKKFLEEFQAKRRQIAAKEQEANMRNKEAEDKRKKLKQVEESECDKLMHDINYKIASSDLRYQMKISDKTLRVRERLDKVKEDVEKNKGRQIQLQEEYIQKLVGKLVTKEESIKDFRDKHFKATKKREADIAMKTKRYQEHQYDIQEQYKDRMKEINERFKKVQENLENKREADLQNRKLKGELNRLKILDKLENHTRLQRRLQFGRLRVLEKEKLEQEKVVIMKNYREIARKTKLEVAINSKLERDRIQENVNQLAKDLYLANSSKVVTRSQKKLLKAILNPDDFNAIEETERQRDLERKIALGLVDDITMASPTLMSSLSMNLKKKNLEK